MCAMVVTASRGEAQHPQTAGYLGSPAARRGVGTCDRSDPLSARPSPIRGGHTTTKTGPGPLGESWFSEKRSCYQGGTHAGRPPVAVTHRRVRCPAPSPIVTIALPVGVGRLRAALAASGRALPFFIPVN